MLRNVTLRFGAAPGEPPLTFAPGPMTVFVGPNNSGKSLALRELESLLESGDASLLHIVRSIVPQLPDADTVERMVRSREVEGDPIAPGWVRVLRLMAREEEPRKRATDIRETPREELVDLAALRAAVERRDSLAGEEFRLVCRQFLALFTLRLDGQTRLALTQPRLAGDLQSNPANHLAALFKDDAARERIREITADALGLYFTIDPTSVPHFRIRMSERPPLDMAEEQALDDRARAFHGRAHDIAALSDGVRAFTGLTAAVMSADYRLMLVDEPEAFLHPPLIRKLGKRLTELAAERAANLLASTHSPDFVMGCIQSGRRVNIVRLTWRAGVASARLLAADKLETMMRDPLLRSTGVLGALFHEGAIVCEADADRVFYAEINERLLAARGGGADGCVFLNAQNKQTIRRIVRPLREMGIPAVALVDLDIFKGKEDFRELMRAGFVPRVFWEPWEERRKRLHQSMKNDDYKSGGIYTLPREARQQANALLAGLAEYGLFVVPAGELENWLPELEVGGHGPEWLTQVFHRMGTDPTSPAYHRPGGGGVWKFMQGVAAWIADPRRRGMADEVIDVAHQIAPPDDGIGEAAGALAEEIEGDAPVAAVIARETGEAGARELVAKLVPPARLERGVPRKVRKPAA
jgi:energy-coupling factor transporter ATP-binding protein EcfA2